jgi:subtilase family serine protease
MPAGTTMRGTPDLALYAGGNPGQAVYTVGFNGGSGAVWMAVGGTSLSSPTLAGFLALVNEARVEKGKGTIPYLNPIIYGMSAQDLAKTFRDIIGGSNGYYTAVAGWDNVTGIGVPQGDGLFEYLVAY